MIKFFLFLVVSGQCVQVKGAISAIRYTEHFPQLPDHFEISGERDADMFDLLEYVFGFQVCARLYHILVLRVKFVCFNFLFLFFFALCIYSDCNY